MKTNPIHFKIDQVYECSQKNIQGPLWDPTLLEATLFHAIFSDLFKKSEMSASLGFFSCWKHTKLISVNL